MDREHRVGRRLKLRHMEILLAVVETGSMARAGRKLAISQPAISRAIAEMEHTLGVPIFDRSPQGVEPTQYGRALLKRGIAAFDEVAQAVKDIDFLADPTVGELWIGTASGLAEGIVLTVLDRLSRQYPRIVVHLVPGGLLVQFEALRQRRIEFGFGGTTGLLAPAGTPADIINRLNTAINASVQSPPMNTSMVKVGFDPKLGSPQDFVTLIIDEIEAWGAAAKSAGIQPE